MPDFRDRRGVASGAAFAGYLVLSVLFFGVRVLAHPGRTYVGGLTTDPQSFIWSFAWWPHAILDGANPFYTPAVWAPTGFNLTWTASVPGLAIPFAPLTLAFGPMVSYNVASLLMPALAAWTAFLLCRHVTRTTWPSLLGGYLFGFSTFMLGGVLGHLQMTAVFLVPLAALIVLRFLEREIGGRGLALQLGAVFALQMLISTEVLFTLTLALLCCLALGFALAPAVRPRLASLAVPLAGAYSLAAVLTSPFLYYIVTGLDSAETTPGARDFVADALNFVLPTHVLATGWWATGLSQHFPTNDVERGTYLGLPILVVVVLFGYRRGRTAAGRFLLAAFVLAALAALGSWLTVYGERVITLPWIHLAQLPLFENVIAIRLSMYSALAAAVMAAMWAASTSDPRWLRVLLPGLAVLALVPNVALREWAGPNVPTLVSSTPPHIPAFFGNGRYRDCLREGEIVLAFPFGSRGNSLIWQAQAGFWFRLAGGYVSLSVPESFKHPPGVARIASNDKPADITVDDLRQFVREKAVTAIVVDALASDPYRALLARLTRPRSVDGALVYRLEDPPPNPRACAG
jgi:hypothetical protein